MTARLITMSDADIVVSYDHGPSTAAHLSCPAGTPPGAGAITTLDRVVVQVSLTFEAVSPVGLIAGPTTMTSIARRTIVKEPVTGTFNRRRAGQSLVELALVVPILLLLFMGTVEVGRLAFAQIALEEAVQQGATSAAQVPMVSAGITARVTTSIDHPEVTGATVSAPACTSNAISVSATYPLALITPLGDALFGGTFQIAATVVATNLTGTCS